MSTCRSFDLAGWLDGGWSAVVEELVDGEQFAAWAVAAGADPAAGPVAVGAPLVGKVAGLAVGALVDGGLAAGAAGRDGGRGGRACAGAPARLPRGVGGGAAPAGGGGAAAAERE